VRGFYSLIAGQRQSSAPIRDSPMAACESGDAMAALPNAQPAVLVDGKVTRQFGGVRRGDGPAGADIDQDVHSAAPAPTG